MSVAACVASLLVLGVGQQGPVSSPAKEAGGITTPAADDRKFELLLVDVLYGRFRVNNSLAALQDDQGRRYLPVRELSKALEFRLFVDAGRKAARGFLSSPTDRIDFDGIRGTCKRKGSTQRFDPFLCFEQD